MLARIIIGLLAERRWPLELKLDPLPLRDFYKLLNILLRKVLYLINTFHFFVGEVIEIVALISTKFINIITGHLLRDFYSVLGVEFLIRNAL